MRVIVAAAGPQHKWGNYLGVPSHLAPVGGEPLLARTLRQALTISDDVHVTYPPGDYRYLDAVPIGVAAHARGEAYPSEYHATHRLWNPDGRTILLLGDTYFTDAAIATIAGFGGRRYQGFGRHGKSNVTGCRYGELWAASWWPEHHKQQDAYLAKIKSLRERGIVTRPTGWMLLRAWQGTDLAKHRCLPEWMTTIDDLTDDFDFPPDYDNHPVIKKGLRKMEAGKGHAARNGNLPALLERLGVEARHVVHVGAHDGEEMPYYQSAKFKKVTLVEPLPDHARRLKAKWPEAEVIEAAAGAKAGKTDLYVMPVTNMSTVIASDFAPSRTVEVKVVRLKDIAKTANVAVIDVQGAELDVLKGADLSRYDVVMVETSTVEDPTMASTYSDVTAYMGEHGFDVAEYWVRDYQWVANWGRRRRPTTPGEVRDVVYRRKETTKPAAKKPTKVAKEVAPDESTADHAATAAVDVEFVDAAGFPGYEDIKLENAETAKESMSE